MTPASVDDARHLGALSAKSLLRSQFRIAHALLDDAIDRLSGEAVHRCPSGSEVSPGVCYAQVVLCEDLCVNGVLSAGKPLALSTWAGRTGLSEIPPLVGKVDWRAWTHRVRLDRNKVRAYALAVYASTDAYLARLAEDALDLTRAETPLCVLNALLLSISMRCGEFVSLLAAPTAPH